MNTDKSHKTLTYMTDHFLNLKMMSPALFYSAVNDLTLLANNSADDDILSMYDSEFHTPQFFIELLENLGYDSEGFPLDI